MPATFSRVLAGLAPITFSCDNFACSCFVSTSQLLYKLLTLSKQIKVKKSKLNHSLARHMENAHLLAKGKKTLQGFTRLSVWIEICGFRQLECGFGGK